jgi:hypothetical protein
MLISRRAFLAAFLIGAGFSAGCSDNSSKGMKNMQMGNERGIQKELPLKKVKKPLPPEPFGPKAPP